MSGRAIASRVAARNPIGAAARFVSRNPRGMMLGGGVLAVVVGTTMLLALTSVQAFLVISQQSTSNTRGRLSFVVDRGDDTPDGTAADLAAGELGPIGVFPDGELAAGTGQDPTATGQAGDGPDGPVPIEETVRVSGIRVHTSIAANLRALLDAAAADGLTLSGWGWRDNAAQIRLRRQNCGTSEYAIYRMPSSRCRPPTARPGRSQHERGLAVDFTYDGRSISSRRSPGFRWLQANAADYGFKNLASEPWHWSTTGR